MTSWFWSGVVSTAHVLVLVVFLVVFFLSLYERRQAHRRLEADWKRRDVWLAHDEWMADAKRRYDAVAALPTPVEWLRSLDKKPEPEASIYHQPWMEASSKPTKPVTFAPNVCRCTKCVGQRRKPDNDREGFYHNPFLSAQQLKLEFIEGASRGFWYTLNFKPQFDGDGEHFFFIGSIRIDIFPPDACHPRIDRLVVGPMASLKVIRGVPTSGLVAPASIPGMPTTAFIHVPASASAVQVFGVPGAHMAAEAKQGADRVWNF